MKLLQIELALLFIAQLTVPFISAYEGCLVSYGRRGCNHRVLEGVLVTCDGMGIEKEIPKNVPKDTVYLSLINFRLNTLTRESFQMFASVECLSIVDSGISKINPDAFSHMTSLVELTLVKTNVDHTSLRFVNHESFQPIHLAVKNSKYLDKITFQATKNLNGLKTLDLGGNSLTEINREIFEELTTLEVLDLSQNKLETLHWDYLNKIPELNQLYLNDNSFQTIPISMYGVFFAVKHLNLGGNNFHCNCNLKWLREFYDVIFDKDIDLQNIECRSPRRRSFNDMNEHDFKCSKPSIPEVQYKQFDGYRFELNCTSHGDPAPTIKMTLPDGRTVITPPDSDLAKLDPLSPQIVSRRGPVTCEARNDQGYRSNMEELPRAVMMSGTSALSALNSLILLITAAIFSLLVTSS